MEVKAAWEDFVGPLSHGQTAVVLAGSLASGVAVAVSATRDGGALRGAILGAVAVDLAGGLIAFQLPPTRARYAGSPRRSRMTFVATHFQPFALPLTGLGSWTRAAQRYAVAVAGTAALEAWDGRGARRSVALAIGAAAGAADLATAPPGQRWLGPVYLVKLIGGHGGIPRAA